MMTHIAIWQRLLTTKTLLHKLFSNFAKKFEKNIFEDISFLEKFFYNLLSNTNYNLRNRYAHIDYNQSIEENNTKHQNYTLEQQAIINAIRENQNITQKEISNIINKSLRTVKTIMTDMQDKKLIARKNGKRDGQWIIL